jgi:hypothetical protein
MFMQQAFRLVSSLARRAGRHGPAPKIILSDASNEGKLAQKLRARLELLRQTGISFPLLQLHCTLSILSSSMHEPQQPHLNSRSRRS